MRFAPAAFLALLVGAFAPDLCAQCTSQWQPGPAYPGVRGTALATALWDPDGPGPTPARAVVGGDFTAAGSVMAANIAAWDPASGQWSALGSGTSGAVRALCVLPNGDLIAGGNFAIAGGVTAHGVARWDGASWSPLANGTAGAVEALAVLPNGDLIAGGGFAWASGVQVDGLARWDGSAWSAAGSGAPGTVHALAVRGTGSLAATRTIVGGGNATSIVEEWNGAQWNQLGGSINGAVRELEVLSTGELVYGGTRNLPAPFPGVARFNGTSWVQLGTGSSFQDVGALLPLPNGELLASVATANTLHSLARWNGSTWGTLSTDLAGRVDSLCALPGGEVLVGGEFGVVSGADVIGWNVVRWSGTAWAPCGAGWNDYAEDVVELPNGDLVVAGDFTTTGAGAAAHVARWDGTGWSALGGGLAGAVWALALLANGDVVASEVQLINGGFAGNRLVRWNGASWSPLSTPNPTFASLRTLLALPNGDLVAAGNVTAVGAQRVARWDGITWWPMDNGLSWDVRDLARMPNGDLVAATNAGVHRFDGTSWAPLGAGYGVTVFVDDAGNLFAAGSSLGVLAWDGSAWLSLGTNSGYGTVHALTRLPNGDLIAGGSFANFGGTNAAHIARFDGAGWQPLGDGTDAMVIGLFASSAGELWAYGTFAVVDGAVSAHVARWTAGCPALAASYGTSCQNPVGTMRLTAASLPWAGGAFRSTCTGMAPLGLGVAVLGLAAASTPLSTLHPAGVPGCDLLAAPDAWRLLLPQQGKVEFELPIPRDPGLAGIVLHHQALQLAAWPLTVVSSNGIRLTVGAY